MSWNIGSIAGNSVILLLGVIFLFFFFKFLPVLLVLAVAVFGGFKIRGAYKRWRNREFPKGDRMEEVQHYDSCDLTNKEIIDVEYYDIDKNL